MSFFPHICLDLAENSDITYEGLIEILLFICRNNIRLLAKIQRRRLN